MTARKKQTPKRKKPAAGELLRGIPHRNNAMKLTQPTRRTTLVEVPLRRPKYLIPPFSWVLPFSSHRRVELDALGTDVLNLCDGARTVERIFEIFAQNHKLSFRESQLAVTKFLQMLSERGIVAIVGPGTARPSS